MNFIPSKGNLTQFLVFDVEDENFKGVDQSFISTRFKPVNVTLASEENWEQFQIKSYLGEIINIGDTIVGYDLQTLNLSGYAEDTSKIKNIPQAILIKKVYPEKSKKKRIWKLKQLEKEESDMKNIHKSNNANTQKENDYEEFLDELEANPDMRSQVNLYKDEKMVKNKEHAPNEIVNNNEEKKDLEIDNEKKSKGKRNKNEEKIEVSRQDNKTDSEFNNNEGPQVKFEELLDDVTNEEIVKLEPDIDDDKEDLNEIEKSIEDVEVELK